VRNIIADTGPLVALFRGRDRDHARVVRFLKENVCLLVTTWPVATEAWHLLAAPARLKFFQWIAAGGIAVLELRPEDVRAMLALLEKYRDRPMDLADASLVVLADRLEVSEILTLDRGDFDTYRLPGGTRFEQVLTV
jgi:predicted nucleic acid-binding protein